MGGGARSRRRRRARARRAAAARAARPSCVDVAATRSARARGRGAPRRSGPDGGDLAGRPRSAAGDLVGAVRARDDDPVVAGASIGSSPSGSISISGQLDDLVARAPRAARRAAGACARGRVTIDPHAATTRDELRGERAGSSPLRRSIQRPSSSATSAVSRSPSWYAATGARQPPPIAPRTRAPPRPGARVSASSRAARPAPPRPRAPAARARPGPPRAAARPARSRRPISRGEAEPVEAAGGEHERVEAALARLAQARVDVAAQRLDRRASARAPGAARAGAPTPCRSASPAAARSAPHERVARIVALEVGADREALRCRWRSCPSRSVRRRRCGRASSASSSSLTKTPRSPICAERARAVAVAGGRDRHERDLDARPPERSAASSACVSASRQPRDPSRTSGDPPSRSSSPNRCRTASAYDRAVARRRRPASCAPSAGAGAC